MRIFGRWNVGNKALFLTVEVDEHKSDKHKNANDSITTESCLRSKVGDKQTTNNGATPTTESMVESLQDALRWRSQVGRWIMSNVWTTCSPTSGLKCKVRNIKWLKRDETEWRQMEDKTGGGLQLLKNVFGENFIRFRREEFFSLQLTNDIKNQTYVRDSLHQFERQNPPWIA